MWLTPSFGDRVKHGERPLNAAKGTSLCAWFVKWVNLVARVGRFDGLSDRMVSLSNHPGFRGLWGFARVGRFDKLSDRHGSETDWGNCRGPRRAQRPGGEVVEPYGLSGLRYGEEASS